MILKWANMKSGEADVRVLVWAGFAAASMAGRLASGERALISGTAAVQDADDMLRLFDNRFGDNK